MPLMKSSADLSLTPSNQGKTSVEDILKYFSYFFQETGFDISCKWSPILHEMPNTVSVKNKRKNRHLFIVR